MCAFIHIASTSFPTGRPSTVKHPAAIFPSSGDARHGIFDEIGGKGRNSRIDVKRDQEEERTTGRDGGKSHYRSRVKSNPLSASSLRRFLLFDWCNQLQKLLPPEFLLLVQKEFGAAAPHNFLRVHSSASGTSRIRIRFRVILELFYGCGSGCRMPDARRPFDTHFYRFKILDACLSSLFLSFIHSPNPFFRNFISSLKVSPYFQMIHRIMSFKSRATSYLHPLDTIENKGSNKLFLLQGFYPQGKARIGSNFILFLYPK